MTAREPYVQKSSAQRTPRPWEVRRNLPDQTYQVLASLATEPEAQTYVAGYKRAQREASERVGRVDATDLRRAQNRRTALANAITDALNHLAPLLDGPETPEPVREAWKTLRDAELGR